MPKFIYKAKKGPREIIKGTIEAETQAEASSSLTRSGYFPISVRKETPYGKEPGGVSFSVFRRISSGKITIFTRQLSALIASGLPILKSLQTLHSQTSDKYLCYVIDDIAKFIKDGGAFSDSLRRHPGIFSRLYVSMVGSGEVAGILESVLEKLANFLDKEYELKAKFKQAMIYPVFLGSVGVIAVITLMIFVVPKLVTMFEEIGQSLPLPTLILIRTSDFFTRFWWSIILAGFLIYFLLKQKTKSKTGKIALDNLKLKLPVFGRLLHKIELARFTRILGTLLENGISILYSLEIAGDIVQNEVIKEEVKKASDLVREGETLAVSLGKMPHFPALVNNMVAVGESGGRLDRALFRVAGLYEEESGRELITLTALLEPAMILLMGLVVGFVVIAMLLPIFEFNVLVR